MTKVFALSVLMLAPASLGGCATPSTQDAEQISTRVYLGVEPARLAPELVEMKVAMEVKGTDPTAAVEEYARCAASRFALDQRAGFIRHIRTNVTKESKRIEADAVYMMSAALPDGLKTIDAEVTVRDCEARGIPTA